LATVKKIQPQEGFQVEFLKSSADIAIGGGAAGAGKTFALLIESIRNIGVKEYGGVIFRKSYPQIKSQGGLWDTSRELFPYVRGKSVESAHEWRFPFGSKIKFSHLEYDKNAEDWQGSQVPFISFDELTHFSQYQFFYLLSRNRSTCGVKPYFRATCNPDPDSWVADFISWWICQDDKSPLYGYPIPERAGKLRYFMKEGNDIIWGDTKAEVIGKCQSTINEMKKADPEIDENDLIKSVTFIPGDIYSNKALMRKDPGYLANLLAQDEDMQLRLLKGNWKVKIGGDDLVNFIKLKDAFGNDYVKGGRKFITADIALKGSDLLVIFVWDGFRIIDCFVESVSKGDKVIDTIKFAAEKYKVPQSRIVYDDDGAGSFVDGFIRNARAFKNGSKALRGENYRNLKSQCYFKMADRINTDGYAVSPEVLKKKIGNKTIEHLLIEERRAIKQDKPDHDGKLAVIPKEKMKDIIKHSPDFFDAWMMREYFELTDNIYEPQDYSKEKLNVF
jgi:hypothetical protein